MADVTSKVIHKALHEHHLIQAVAVTSATHSAKHDESAKMGNTGDIYRGNKENAEEKEEEGGVSRHGYSHISRFGFPWPGGNWGESKRKEQT